MRGFSDYYRIILAAIRLLHSCRKIGKQVNGVYPQRKAHITTLLQSLKGGRAVICGIRFSWGEHGQPQRVHLMGHVGFRQDVLGVGLWWKGRRVNFKE